MRRKIRYAGVAVSILLLLLPCGAADDAAPDDSSVKQITLVEYRQELSRIDKELRELPQNPERASDLSSSIPDMWKVQTSSGTFDIDNEDIRYRLDRYADSPTSRNGTIPGLLLKIEARLGGTREFEQPVDTAARAKLEAILQGREYRNVARAQSPWEKLKEWLLNRVLGMLTKLFRAAGAHPRISRFLMWSIIGLVIAGFVVWLYFLLRRSARDEYAYPRDKGVLVPSNKPWQEWLREAQAAGERGDWRDAVHLAYWGAISYLESSGAWKPDRARTPREYLRMLKPVGPKGERREPLEALTRRFEFVWYAQQTASPDDYQFTLAQLDKIGCR